MRKIIINSDVMMEPIALVCAHLQNVQTHSVIITDSTSLLTYGEQMDIDTSVAQHETYLRKFNDVIIAYIPEMIKATDSSQLLGIIDDTIEFISTATLETIENAVLYFGSTQVPEEYIKDMVATTESTYLQFIGYKSTEKLEDRFVWQEDTGETETTDNFVQYTVLFNKKYIKQATKLKRPIFQLSEKDVLGFLEVHRQEKFTSNGLIKTTAIKACSAQMGVPEQTLESWLAQQ